MQLRLVCDSKMSALYRHEVVRCYVRGLQVACFRSRVELGPATNVCRMVGAVVQAVLDVVRLKIGEIIEAWSIGVAMDRELQAIWCRISIPRAVVDR